MPGRLLNFGAMIAVALLCGLIGAAGKTLWSAVLMLYLSVGLLIGNRSMFWEWLAKHSETVVRDVVPERPARPLQILLIVSLALVAWERYPRERWQQIRRAYNVTQVLTYPQWALNLPVVDRNPSYVLYEIPD